MIKGWLNLSTPPENLLMKYATTGEQKYLASLVEQFNLSLYHFLLSLSDKALAEDVLQITWLKVINKASQYQQHTNVKSWLFTIARNSLIDELRKQQKWQWQELSEDIITSKSPCQVVEKHNRLAQFNAAINALPFPQREVFIFQQEGFSVIEIAQLTNENFETVKSRLRYARNNLKALLGTHHEQ